LGQQLGDLHLAVERALAPYLRRMSGENRNDVRGGKEPQQALARDARLLRAHERPRHAALAGCRCGAGMGARAPDMVLVLGAIGEVREEAVGPDDMDRLLARQAVERALQRLARRLVLRAVEPDGGLAHVLDDIEDRLALLLADGVAEDPPEQPD